MNQTIPDTDVYRCPTTQEYRSGDTCDDKEIEELSEVEEAEAHTRILRMVTSGQLTLSLCHIKRATVGLSVTCDEEYEEGDQRRNMSLEDQPLPRAYLCLHDTTHLHRTCQDHGCDQTEAERHLVRDHLHSTHPH